MIVHRSISRARPVYVVNSRLPVYKVVYGNGIGDVITGLFTRVTPKILPIGKEIASKAIGVVCDRIGTVIGNKIVDTFGAVREKLMSLVRKKKPVKLPSTDQMPPDIAKQINELAKQKLGGFADGNRLIRTMADSGQADSVQLRADSDQICG